MTAQEAHEEQMCRDDPVNHPLRYTKGEVECIDAIDSAVVGKPPDEAVCVANVLKYVWRYEEKEPVRSLESARWYLDRLIGKVRRRLLQGGADAFDIVDRGLESDPIKADGRFESSPSGVDGGPASILTTISRGGGL